MKDPTVLRQSTCADCGARFPISRTACGLCGGAALRVERYFRRVALLHLTADAGEDDVERDEAAEYAMKRALRLRPTDARRLDGHRVALEWTWEMRRMRERVAALAAEERRSARAVKVVTVRADEAA